MTCAWRWQPAVDQPERDGRYNQVAVAAWSINTNQIGAASRYESSRRSAGAHALPRGNRAEAVIWPRGQQIAASAPKSNMLEEVNGAGATIQRMNNAAPRATRPENGPSMAFDEPDPTRKSPTS